VQLKYNAEHGIQPETVKRAIRSGIESEIKARRTVQQAIRANEETLDQTEIVKLLEEEMLEAARNLEFERAAQLRDKLNEIRGAPVIKSGNAWAPDGEADSQHKIWQPKTPKRGGRRVAK
jgi:excinuclease ABC subunit B